MGYDRFNLESLSNLLAVSRDNSLYRFGLAYEIIEPLRLGVELSQNFDPVYREGGPWGRRNRIAWSPTFGWPFVFKIKGAPYR